MKGIRVDVHRPDPTVHVEVRGKHTYVYGDDLPGPGGLPVGTSGKVMLLLSGGIDSPVAGYLSLNGERSFWRSIFTVIPTPANAPGKSD